MPSSPTALLAPTSRISRPCLAVLDLSSPPPAATGPSRASTASWPSPPLPKSTPAPLSSLPCQRHEKDGGHRGFGCGRRR
uniref:Uncharacterized protein n=1 Tax=Triticum urartu TaxID=4572 RepID=A0A8R7TT86_TRIUA